MSARTSRRAVMLGGAGSLALAAPAASCAALARNPDAALIAHGREHARIEQEQAEIEAAADRVRATGCDVQPLNDRSDALNERMCFITENAAVLQARTPDGVRAKVVILGDSWSFALRGLDKVGDCQHELAWSIVWDLAGMKS